MAAATWCSATATLADRALKDPGENAANLTQRSFPHPWVTTADLVQHLLRWWRRVIAQQLFATARLEKVRPTGKSYSYNL